jgi:hypothetical protein
MKYHTYILPAAGITLSAVMMIASISISKIGWEHLPLVVILYFMIKTLVDIWCRYKLDLSRFKVNKRDFLLWTLNKLELRVDPECALKEEWFKTVTSLRKASGISRSRKMAKKKC